MVKVSVAIPSASPPASESSSRSSARLDGESKAAEASRLAPPLSEGLRSRLEAPSQPRLPRVAPASLGSPFLDTDLWAFL